MSKYIYSLLINSLLVFTIHGQSHRLSFKTEEKITRLRSGSTQHYCFPDKRAKRGSWIGSAGITAGQEYFISFPKLSCLREFPLTRNRPKYGFSNFSFYAGVEGSMFVMYAGVFGISANVGVAIGPFTVDNSITRTAIVGPSGERPGNYTTYNPKLGLNIGPIWLKAGPSILMDGNGIEDWAKINNRYYNFEVLYIFPIED